jgi:NADH:ubiquinone oxidoreductase subunit 3 (subunit A)
MDLNILFLLPPVVFFIILAVVAVQAFFMKQLAPKVNTDPKSGKFETYACGENVEDSRVQPDYNRFFSFAFFFTIMHVVALVIATVPVAPSGIIYLGLLYIIGAIFGLMILYRR